jgi:pyruvate formate lyase activating enzyme
LACQTCCNPLSETGAVAEPEALIFNIMRFSLHDGPGIRTTLFFKGCPLACWWCHNPESQSFLPEVLYAPERCALCGDCVAACPEGALAIQDSQVRVAAGLCERCGACVEACRVEARQMAGRRIGLAEAVREVERDLIFFEESGGGVTLSGGEPLSQPQFAEALLDELKRRGIHTVLDTCGFARRDTFLRIAGKTSLVYFDLKLLDSLKHRMYTGVPNEPILDNLKALVEAGIPLRVRFPLIPGVNDGDEDIEQMSNYLKGLGVHRIDLLPYHKIGIDKYRRLGLQYRLAGLAPPEDAEIERVSQKFGQKGVSIKVGG